MGDKRWQWADLFGIDPNYPDNTEPSERALGAIQRIPRDPDKVTWKNGPLGQGREADAFRKGYTDAMEMVYQQIEASRDV